MHNNIRTVINSIYPLGEPDMEALLSCGTIVNLRKGDPIFRQGEVETGFVLLCEGVLRAYVEKGGKQTVVWFNTPGEVVVSSWGYLCNEPAKLSIAASCPAVIIRWERERIEKLFTRSPEIGIWGRRLYLKVILNMDEAMVALSSQSAAERYEGLAGKMPDLFQYVSLKELAGYLGIAPESLSRLRARLAKK